MKLKLILSGPLLNVDVYFMDISIRLFVYRMFVYRMFVYIGIRIPQFRPAYLIEIFLMKKTRKTPKKSKAYPKVDKWDNVAENLGSATGYVILAIWFVVKLPFLILKWTYFLFVKFPHVSSMPLWCSMLLGTVRVFLSLYFCTEYQPGCTHNQTDLFFQTYCGVSSAHTETTITILGGLCALNFIFQLLLMFGFQQGKIVGYGNSTSNEFLNIEEGLRFRDGCAEMQASRGKMEEYSKTAFVTADTFRNLSEQSDAYREAVRFLDSTLAQQSTRGKYEMLKKMFGGDKT